MGLLSGQSTSFTMFMCFNLNDQDNLHMCLNITNK